MTGAHRSLRASTVLTLALSLYAIGTAHAGTSGGQCLRDAAGLSQGTICTANDVRIGRFAGFELFSRPGFNDTVEVVLRGKDRQTTRPPERLGRLAALP